MPIQLRLALRYFWAFSKQTVINRINAIALSVVVIATAALMIVLSAFGGLKDFGLSFTQSLHPTYRVLPTQGKTLMVDSLQLQAIIQIAEVSYVAPVIEEKVFLRFQEKTQVAYLKGVGKNYNTVVAVDSLLVVGQWPVFEQAKVVAGYGIASTLGLGVYDFDAALELSFPQNNQGGLLGRTSLATVSTYVVGLYQVSEDLDNKYVFAGLSLAQDFLGYPPNTFTGLEIKSPSPNRRTTLQQNIEKILNQPVVVDDQQTMNAAFYKMLNAENLAVYLIFTLVMIIAMFNVIGALVMMRLDKAPQSRILLALGLLPHQLQQVFFLLGALLSGVGGLVGILIAVVLIGVQQAFPFLYVPGTRLPYPVVLHLQDVLLVALTVMSLGSLAAWWATRGIAKTAGGR